MNEVNWWELETQHSDTVTRDELKTSLAAALARAEAAESELSKYRQWHEQAQIRAVDAEFELAQFMDDMIACLGLPDREYGDSVGEVIVAAVTKIIARAEAAEARLEEIDENFADPHDPNDVPNVVQMVRDAINDLDSEILKRLELEAELDTLRARAEAAEALAASVFQDTGEFVGKLYEVLGRELDYEEGSSFDEIVGAVAALRDRVAELEAAQDAALLGVEEGE